MDADGTQNGFDLEITAAVSRAVSIPVVASGGAGRPEHFVDAILRRPCRRGLAAGIFHFGQYTIGEVKQQMHERGIPVRWRQSSRGVSSSEQSRVATRCRQQG